MMKLSTMLFLTVFGTDREMQQSDSYKAVREMMVETQIASRNIKDTRILEAMKTVPRHLFVLKNLRHLAYKDSSLPIGYHQTISQPFIVAFMIEAAEVSSNDRVLEIGTGCGYQAAVLSQLCKEVYTIEIIQSLAEEASHRLKAQGYQNVHVRYGNGQEGWFDAAPFDAILVTAAARRLPPLLLAQLKIGGRLIVPIEEGTFKQNLIKYTKTKNGLKQEMMTPVRFVPMTGKGQEK